MNSFAYYDEGLDPHPGGQQPDANATAVDENRANTNKEFSITRDTYKIDIQAGTRIRVMPLMSVFSEATMRNVRNDIFFAMGDIATDLVDTMVVDLRLVKKVASDVTNIAADTAADDRADLYFGMTNVAHVQFDGEQDTLVDDVVAATESPEFSPRVLVVDDGMTVDNYSMAFEAEVEQKLHLHEQPINEELRMAA